MTERCQHCVDRHDGVYGSFAAPCPRHNDDGSPRSPKFRQSTDRAAVVAPGFHWIPIDANAPRGRKVQLINRPAGVACQGTLGSGPNWWTHWAPLPTFAD